MIMQTNAFGGTRQWVKQLDRATRAFWRLRGRPVDLGGAHRWLAAPMHDAQRVGDGWLRTAASDIGATLREPADGGLLADLAQLDGPDFRAADLRPEVRDFYQRTASWRMEVWTQWTAAFQPGGELVSRLFGRRVQQLALPTRPLDVAHGVDSRVVVITGPDGAQRAAGWIRTLCSTGRLHYKLCRSMKREVLSRSPSHRLTAMALTADAVFPWRCDCRARGHGRSDIASIGQLPAQLSGVGREGGQVPRGVVVPIQDHAARRAHIPPLGQAQLGFRRTASRADLRAGEPAVRHDQPHPGPLGFVAELAADLRPAGPGDVPGQPLVAQHPGHVQVLDHDHVVLADQPGGELVGVVAAQVRHPGVDPIGAGPGLAPPVRRRLTGAPVRAAAARHPPLRAAQPPQLTVQAAAVRDPPTGGQGGQRGDAQVDPDDPAIGARRGLAVGQLDVGQFGVGEFDGERDCQRPRCQDRVAERIRAVPVSILRASLRVDSQVRTTPMRGSRTCRRSAARPNAPVVNRQLGRERRPLNRGDATLRPARTPDREEDQFDRAAAGLASPDE
jgi:hypothetical protein